MLTLVCAGFIGYGQISSRTFYADNNFQYGATLKATLFFDYVKKVQKPYFRLGADVGVGSTAIDKWLYPSVNLDVQFYNGGLGTRKHTNGKGPPTYFEFSTALTLTGGVPNKLIASQADDRNVFLYYFSTFATPALQNPYNHSISVGTVWVFSSDTAKKTQRLGVLNLNFGGGAQFSFNDDGGPIISQADFGDGYDRFHTGGGMLIYNGPKHTLFNTIELTYNKFTGFTQKTFEASNELFLAYMQYNDPEQKYFNRSLYDLSISNPYRGFGINLEQYNCPQIDMQNIIHTVVLDTFHEVPYPVTYTVGFTYYGGLQQIGVR